MHSIPFSEEAAAEAISVIKNGGVIVVATETCYGLTCDLRNAAAVEKLFAIKDRPRTQPISCLFESVDASREWVVWNEQAEELASTHLPGPLTIILPIQEGVSLFPTLMGGTTLGVRVSPHPHALTLAKTAGFPLSTTSANVHGQPNPYSIEDMVEQFNGRDMQPDLVLDAGALPINAPSTVIDLTKEVTQTLRKGDIRM